MIRMTLAAFLTALTVAGPAFAQATTTPPPTQTPPPAQTPPAEPATPAPFPADAKVGFVNFQTLLDISTLGKASLQKLQTLAAQKKTEMTGMETQITTLQQEIQSQSSVLSPTALNERQLQLQRLQGQYQLAQQDAQSEIDLLQNQLLDAFEAKAVPIIEAIRTEKGLWFVLAIQDGGGLAVVSAMDGLNLTPEVGRRMDAAAGGAGG
jgi:Skp family chaperone for outer membrane proteins